MSNVKHTTSWRIDMDETRHTHTNSTNNNRNNSNKNSTEKINTHTHTHDWKNLYHVYVRHIAHSPLVLICQLSYSFVSRHWNAATIINIEINTTICVISPCTCACEHVFRYECVCVCLCVKCSVWFQKRTRLWPSELCLFLCMNVFGVFQRMTFSNKKNKIEWDRKCVCVYFSSAML